MRHIVISGGPGVGKTTLLAALARRGYATVSESARELISERLARGESPRPDPEAFARAILRRDLEKFASPPRTEGLIFYDRSAVEALGMLHETSPQPANELATQLAALNFSKTVFVLPPWRAIYRTDSERDHTFEHVIRVHAQVIRWYGLCGYTLHEVPRLPVEQRVDHVLRCLSSSGNA